jgi:Tfp pilus assembly protein PilO
MTSNGARGALWRRMLVPFAVLVGLNALVFGLYTLPRSVQERSLSSRVETLRADVERERKAVADRRDRVDAVRSNTGDTERFYRQVVFGREESLASSLEELDHVAGSLGLKPGPRTFDQEEVDGAPLVRFVVTMPVSGSYRELTSFLDRLERSPRFLTVDSIRLREKKEEGVVDLNVVISTYFRAPGRAVGG